MRNTDRQYGMPGVWAAVCAMGLLVAACSPEDREPPEPAVPVTEETPLEGTAIAYVCESGRGVSVLYAADRGVDVTYEGRTHRLRPVVSASGARYVGDSLQWWSATRDGRDEGRLSRVDETGETVMPELERCVREGQVLEAASDMAQATLVRPPVMAESPACAGPQLALALEGTDAGAGNRAATLSLRNAGTATCSLTGYPGVTLMGEGERPLTGVRADPWTSAGARATPVAVELPPGAKAWFDMGWSAVPHEGQGETRCPEARAIRVTAPGDTAPLVVEQALSPCGGRIRVSVLRAEREPAD